ncbi:MAG: acyl-CoA thioesterase [Rhodobacteraceae bacterium]|nr:acyl-CoA thioesterase [Paracoccaceae bacterium]
MYPYLRMAKELWKFRNAPALSVFQPHVSTHRVWPWDIDPWMELNNGRTLTLYDLGRLPMGKRMGFDRLLKDKGWGLTVAGNTTRYRRRVTVFQKLTMVSRVLGWDDRFLYIEQSMWRGGDCTSAQMLRGAVISKGGMVPMAQAMAALGVTEASPALPDWVQQWIAADAARLWPPETPGVTP